MKNVALLTLILLLFATCKKNHCDGQDQCGGCKLCPGETNQDTLSFDPWVVDSAMFANWLLGKWYMKQQQFFPDAMNCQSICYSDTNYYFLFLPNNTIIRNLPGNHKDTVMYNFVRDSIWGITNNYGVFFPWPNSSAAPHDTTICGVIQRAGNYLMVGPAYNYPITDPVIGGYYPCYAYGLTR